MKNMKVKTKLLVSFVIMAVISGVVGIVGVTGIRSLKDRGITMYEDHVLAIDALADMRECYQLLRCNLHRLSIVCELDDQIELNEVLRNADIFIDKMTEAFKYYGESARDEAQEANFHNCKRVFENEYIPMVRELQKIALETGSTAETYLELRAEADVVSRIEGFLAGMTADNVKWANELNEKNVRESFLLTLVQISALSLAVFFALFFAVYISRIISVPLKTLTDFMKKAGETGDITVSDADRDSIAKHAAAKDEIGQCIDSASKFMERLNNVSGVLEHVSEGDLTSEINLLSPRDVMGNSLNTLTDKFSGMFEGISASAVQVTQGANQVSEGSQSLAQGCAEQAASIQQLSASIEDIAEKARRTAAMTGEAAELSGTIKAGAEKGGTQMSRLVQAVTEINDASQSIGKVIKVIDDIAFQTNILALNAAVEAARAGQQGKGFAVVAEEVRNLAAKSAESAQDTSKLIENSINKAGFGLNIATETQESLEEIVSGINRNVEIIRDIADSSGEQAAAVSQINIGINQISQVVQQNSATAQESAAASEEMNGQASLLREQLARFKTKG
ncbi:MAG: methyl-accepting chemotaxis protein [Oscillospiraceae bacterium]|jgi:methyl-accepting chemotaxis protein|nr:methyl-accepting chemotaxis protein [Oscillospiraceae bacterium]